MLLYKINLIIIYALAGTANFLIGKLSFLLSCLRVTNFLSNLVILLLIALVSLGLKSKGICFILRFFIVVLISSSFPSLSSFSFFVTFTLRFFTTSAFLFSLIMVNILAICFLKSFIFDNFATAVLELLVKRIFWSSSLYFFNSFNKSAEFFSRYCFALIVLAIS